MECYFDGNNQFYTIGGLILLVMSLGANMLTCAYWPKISNEREESLITSCNYVGEQDKESKSDLEMGEVNSVSKSTNTSPHVCTVRRYTPIWSASHREKGTKYKDKLPDWVRKEYINKNSNQEREFL
jgi:replication initiation and membrane attachment protein DnaB